MAAGEVKIFISPLLAGVLQAPSGCLAYPSEAQDTEKRGGGRGGCDREAA